MNIIIAGVGDVGFHLAKLLTNENHDIVLIDTDKDKLEYANNHLDVSCMQGRSISKEILKNCQIDNCDLLISCTDSEENNILTGIIGKKLGAKKTIARVKDTRHIEEYDDMGIDDLISTEYLASQEIRRLLRGSFTDSFDFDNGLFRLIGLHIMEGSALDGSLTSESCCNCDNYRTAAVLRNNETFLPNGDFELKGGDFIYFLTKSGQTDKIQKLCGQERNNVRSIMVIGANNISYHLIKQLSRYYRVKLIDKDVKKCQEFGDKLPNIELIVNGDVHDNEMLKEESLGSYDAFISLTDNTETNIMSCLLAKKEGVKKTIALVDNVDYIHLSQNIGIDTMINKKLASADFIFKHIRKGSLISQATLHGVDAEVLEYSIDNGSKFLGKLIKDISLPGKIIGMVRDDIPFIPNYNSEFRLGDRVISIVKSENLSIFEKKFSR